MVAHALVESRLPSVVIGRGRSHAHRNGIPPGVRFLGTIRVGIVESGGRIEGLIDVLAVLRAASVVDGEVGLD